MMINLSKFSNTKNSLKHINSISRFLKPFKKVPVCCYIFMCYFDLKYILFLFETFMFGFGFSKLKKCCKSNLPLLPQNGGWNILSHIICEQLGSKIETIKFY